MYAARIYHMDPKSIIEYMSLLGSSYKRNLELDITALDILEQFAWEEHLSAYDLFSRLNSMDIKIAYKNVNVRVHKLLSSGLIYKTQGYGGSNNKRKAKYYKLTEYGIFQLFLNRLNSLLFNQYQVRKSQTISTSYKTFFRNYMNSKLFESFIYSHIEKQTLSAIGDYLLWNSLYLYLGNCCQLIDYELRTKEEYRTIPHEREIFVWNEISDNEEEKPRLLHFLKHKFNLKDTKFSNIKNDKKDNTIIVRTSAYSAPIILRLDDKRDKVIISSTDENDQYKEYEYDVEYMGSEIVVVEPMIYEETKSRGIIDKSKNEVEQLIYEFICSLGVAVADSERSKEYLYYREILSQDKKFMKTVQGIYENRYKAFERGYNTLTAIR
jgi:hypothetical protein